jgi:hypothetical protein
LPAAGHDEVLEKAARLDVGLELEVGLLVVLRRTLRGGTSLFKGMVLIMTVSG